MFIKEHVRVEETGFWDGDVLHDAVLGCALDRVAHGRLAQVLLSHRQLLVHPS